MRLGRFLSDAVRRLGSNSTPGGPKRGIDASLGTDPILPDAATNAVLPDAATNASRVDVIQHSPDTPMGVSKDVQDEVTGILEESDKRKLRYFILALIHKNLGISTHTVESADYSPDTLNVTIPGKYKDDGSIAKILLQETLKNKSAKLHDETTLHIGNLVIECVSYGLKVKPKGKIRDADLESLRDFFEGTFLKQYLVNEQSAINIRQVRGLLELQDSDFVHLDEKGLEIQLPQETPISLTPQLMADIGSEIHAASEEYSVKVKPGMYNALDGQSPILVIHNLTKKSKLELHCTFRDGKLIIRIGTTYTNLELDRGFIEIILKKYIYLLTASTTKKRDSLTALRDMGVLVFEKEKGAQRQTLDELYTEEGFVGYDDIKASLAVNIVYPWEKREPYTTTAQDRFPHMKSIIPNTALFEGPPGTGKTTQAKIIGKYLGYPFIYIPIGTLMSKWYGESERRLDRIFELARVAAVENGGIIIMIDEIDEIGKNRENSHEATARMTGVLLKKLDGIEQVSNLLLIGSTNRKDSMDPALLSRFSRQVYFRLPENAEEIRNIFSFYIPEARGLDDAFFQKLMGKSPRDIKNMAEDVARKFLEMQHVHQRPVTIEELLRQL